MLLLCNHLHEKSITESQDRQIFDSVHMLFVICTYNIILLLLLLLLLSL